MNKKILLILFFIFLISVFVYTSPRKLNLFSFITDSDIMTNNFTLDEGKKRDLDEEEKKMFEKIKMEVDGDNIYIIFSNLSEEELNNLKSDTEDEDAKVYGNSIKIKLKVIKKIKKNLFLVIIQNDKYYILVGKNVIMLPVEPSYELAIILKE